MKTTTFTFTLSLVLFISLFIASCTQMEHVLPTTTAVDEDLHHHDHNNTHPADAVYYDFRGLTDHEILLKLDTESEEQLAARTESDRLVQYLISKKMETRILSKFGNTELLTIDKLATLLSKEQLDESLHFVPANIVSKRGCVFHYSQIWCKAGSGGGSTYPGHSTIPEQNGGGIRKKSCYYKNGSRVHRHHTHTIAGSCTA